MGSQRLSIVVASAGADNSSLREDVLAGLFARQKHLPPRHFYDARGSALFDAICDTPEYYPTRVEDALLRDHAHEILRSTRPRTLVELGSGTARKTRRLFDAAAALALPLTYVPVDVSESTLRESAAALLGEYPWLEVRGVVGAFTDGLERLPAAPPRLFAFLGGTLGNFEPADATRFLRSVRARMDPADAFLLGTDLVKDKATIEAAYNDRAGLTAAFNKNVLTVMNRELGADFDLEAFDHLAFFDEEKSRIEMHLRSRKLQKVHFAALGRTALFEAGESLRTEISRKLCEASLRTLFASANLRLDGLFTPKDESFALSLGRPC